MADEMPTGGTTRTFANMVNSRGVKDVKKAPKVGSTWAKVPKKGC